MDESSFEVVAQEKIKVLHPNYLHQLEADQFEPSLLKAPHDFSHQFPLDAIRLHGNKGALIHTRPA